MKKSTEKKINLFEKVLEQMILNFREKLMEYLNDEDYENTMFCASGLWVVKKMLWDIGDYVSDDDDWTDSFRCESLEKVANDLFSENGLCGTVDMFDEVNEKYGICTKKEVEEMIQDLKKFRL